MKNNDFVKVWNVIYPILVYYVLSNVVMALAIFAMGVTEETYRQNYTMLQTIATAVALPVLYGFYRRDQMMFTVFHQRIANERRELSPKRQVLYGVSAFLCGALAGLVLNNIIGATGLMELSKGYQNVTAQFFAGSMLFEIIGIGILVPIVEEILYRGIVYARLSDWIGLPGAAVISALIFGGLHMNLVQFIYAFLLGLMLVYLMERCHNLYGAVLAHVGANLITVLRTETRFLDWMQDSMTVYWISTAAMAVVCAGIILLMKAQKNSKEEKQ